MDNPSPIAPYIGCSKLMAAFAKCEKQGVLEEALSKAYGLHDGFAEWVDKKVTERTEDLTDRIWKINEQYQEQIKAIEERRVTI